MKPQLAESLNLCFCGLPDGRRALHLTEALNKVARAQSVCLGGAPSTAWPAVKPEPQFHDLGIDLKRGWTSLIWRFGMGF